MASEVSAPAAPPTVRFACVCDRGLQRASNQDRALAEVNARLFVVCDGVGGNTGGEIASQTAIETVRDAFITPDDHSPLARLERAIHYANRDIFEMAKHDLDLAGMATTLVALHLDGDTACVAHAGDSRLYHFANGTLTQVTTDHTPLQDAVRRGDLSLAEAQQLPKVNEVSRALGVFPEVEVEVQDFAFTVGSRFLLCTDGVTRHISNEELEGLMTTFRDNPDGLCDEIHRYCYERGAEDNFTALVVCVDPPIPDPPPASLPSLPSLQERLTRTRELSIAPSFPADRTTGEHHPLRELVEARRERARRGMVIQALIILLTATLAFSAGWWMGSRQGGLPSPAGRPGAPAGR
ncbi:serine/threonine-protein phosphatase [Chloracidobacterium validum]|uniref:Serine/threonine-protein phosphatase n=1 Tax=Chloracidobacterium validum TaxID=2821543 RepID=A0ABX8B4U7_9BACT|nr:protein phosphatase 2C domain-containing protein [Chloracidobacterium validum]QUW02007.1 serine/threonine-protein phosphatase [Chloracidobacterium validum]